VSHQSTGIVSVPIDSLSGELATAACPKVRTEYFEEGTQPVEMCRLHGGGIAQVAGWETSQPARAADPSAAGGLSPGAATANVARNGSAAVPETAPRPQEPRRHKSFFERLRGIFK
jgi:penicillin-binding protein 1B